MLNRSEFRLCTPPLTGAWEKTFFGCPDGWVGVFKLLQLNYGSGLKACAYVILCFLESAGTRASGHLVRVPKPVRSGVWS